MKAAVVTRYGAPEVLQIRDVPLPVPGAEEILVRVRAIGLNFADIFGRFGVYPGTPKPPFIPGLEFSGEVVSWGEQVDGFAAGDRVMGYSRHGSHAEYLAVHCAHLAPVPEEMTFEQAASFIATGLTAYHGIVRLAGLRRGERILVHAAAGGVGLASLQIAADIGAEIFATAGTDAKLELARTHGAHHLINYASTDFAREVRRICSGGGVDVVMDGVGGDVFRKSWAILEPMGRYVLFGVSAVTGRGALSRLKAAAVFARMGTLFPWQLIGKNKGIFGFNLGTLTGKEPYLREAAGAILALNRRGVLRPVVGQVFRFEEIVAAHRHLQERKSVGKVVVTLDSPPAPFVPPGRDAAA